jgi:hypothetical protein
MLLATLSSCTAIQKWISAEISICSWRLPRESRK